MTVQSYTITKNTTLSLFRYLTIYFLLISILFINRSGYDMFKSFINLLIVIVVFTFLSEIGFWQVLSQLATILLLDIYVNFFLFLGDIAILLMKFIILFITFLISFFLFKKEETTSKTFAFTLSIVAIYLLFIA